MAHGLTHTCRWVVVPSGPYPLGMGGQRREGQHGEQVGKAAAEGAELAGRGHGDLRLHVLWRVGVRGGPARHEVPGRLALPALRRRVLLDDAHAAPLMWPVRLDTKSWSGS